jgi:hypothetical protein
MFASKATACPRMEHLKVPALPENIKPGWKCLPGKNALAYYEKAELTAIKSFITLATGLRFRLLRSSGVKFIKHFICS